MLMSTVLNLLLDMSIEAKNFYQLVTKEIDYQKSQNLEEAWVNSPYDKTVFVCAAVLKGILEDESYKVDLVHKNSECYMIISWRKKSDENLADEDPIKSADNLALQNEFESAIKNYESIIEQTIFDSCIKKTKNQGIIPKLMFKCVLCALGSNDIVSYKTELSCASVCRNDEITFLENIGQAVINHDIKSFTETVRKFDAISPLDTWTTTILLKIKNNISN